MSGFVDLHLHLLPGVDDGCKTLDETVEMAKVLVSLGFSAAAPSPHNRPEYAPAERALAALETVTAELQARGVGLALEPNAENFFLDENLLATLSRRIGRAGAYLLVEAPYTAPLPSLVDHIFRMKLKGVTPVIAHPERCFEFEKKGRAAQVVDQGAVLQLDIGALIGRYGKTAQRLARSFLDEGLYGIGATDLHSPVGAAAWVAESIKALEKAAGSAALTKLLGTNPARVLAGQSLD